MPEDLSKQDENSKSRACQEYIFLTKSANRRMWKNKQPVKKYIFVELEKEAAKPSSSEAATPSQHEDEESKQSSIEQGEPSNVDTVKLKDQQQPGAVKPHRNKSYDDIPACNQN